MAPRSDEIETAEGSEEAVYPYGAIATLDLQPIVHHFASTMKEQIMGDWGRRLKAEILAAVTEQLGLDRPVRDVVNDAMRQSADELALWDGRLPWLIAQHGLTYRQLGQRIGCSHQTVGAVVKGRKPSLPMHSALLRAFGLTVDQLRAITPVETGTPSLSSLGSSRRRIAINAVVDKLPALIDDQIRRDGVGIRGWAAKHGLKESSLSKWLSGVQRPTVDKVDQLLAILGKTHYDVIGDRRWREIAGRNRGTR